MTIQDPNRPFYEMMEDYYMRRAEYFVNLIARLNSVSEKLEQERQNAVLAYEVMAYLNDA